MPELNKPNADSTSYLTYQQMLRESQALSKLVYDNAWDIVTIVSDDGIIRCESPSLTHFLGYEQDERTGQNIVSYVHRDDVSGFLASCEKAQVIPSLTYSVEFRLQHKDQSWRTFEAIITNLLHDSTVNGLIIHCHDISKRQKVVEEKFMLMHDNDRQREELRRLTTQHQQLAQHVILSQEKERQRVARELHDEAGQALTALKISLEMIASSLPVDGNNAAWYDLIRQRVGNALSLCQTTVEHIRHLAYTLRPAALDDLGLELALEGFCRDYAGHTQLSVTFQCAEIPVLSEAAELCLFRFLQEGLSNVAKHAKASHVLVTLTCKDGLVQLLIQDNGIGLPLSEVTHTLNGVPGMGLLGMRERLESLGGRLEINSIPGKGTSLLAVLSIKEVGNAAT